MSTSSSSSSLTKSPFLSSLERRQRCSSSSSLESNDNNRGECLSSFFFSFTFVSLESATLMKKDARGCVFFFLCFGYDDDDDALDDDARFSARCCARRVSLFLVLDGTDVLTERTSCHTHAHIIAPKQQTMRPQRESRTTKRGVRVPASAKKAFFSPVKAHKTSAWRKSCAKPPRRRKKCSTRRRTF